MDVRFGRAVVAMTARARRAAAEAAVSRLQHDMRFGRAVVTMAARAGRTPAVTAFTHLWRHVRVSRAVVTMTARAGRTAAIDAIRHIRLWVDFSLCPGCDFFKVNPEALVIRQNYRVRFVMSTPKSLIMATERFLLSSVMMHNLLSNFRIDSSNSSLIQTWGGACARLRSCKQRSFFNQLPECMVRHRQVALYRIELSVLAFEFLDPPELRDF
jgi:hypothetical protein